MTTTSTSPPAAPSGSIPFLDVGATYRELKAEVDAATARVLESGHYILGPEVEAFEGEFARYAGTSECVGVANGLDALYLALRAAGVGAGDEVIVPSNTYVATWLATSYAGAVAVPVEPVEGTYNLDPARIEAALTPRTRAVIPVHLYGQPADVDAVMEVAAPRGLFVLEDAAQAHGARLRGRPAGSLGHAAAWSFYPGKNLGAFGDAGALTTSDPRIADRVRVLRNYGSRVKYHNEVRGVNSRLDPLQAAVLRAKLPALDEWNARRARIAALYLDRLRDVEGVRLPEVPAWAEPAWHVFVVRVADRAGVQEALARRGIGTLVHYPVPPHLQPAYAEAGYGPGAFPLAEAMADEVLSLPIGPHLAEEDALRVAAALAEAVRGSR